MRSVVSTDAENTREIEINSLVIKVVSYITEHTFSRKIGKRQTVMWKSK